MTADFDTIRAGLNRRALRDEQVAALDALARVQAERWKAVENELAEYKNALRALVEHIDLNGGCHRGCPEHDDARAALVSADPKEGSA